MHRPNMTHVPTRPSAGSAKWKSPSQLRAMLPRPIARSASFSGPCGP